MALFGDYAIKQRDSAFRQYRKDKSDFNYCTFKSLRNKTQYLIDSAKFFY